jgi:hypothetical protein
VVGAVVGTELEFGLLHAARVPVPRHEIAALRSTSRRTHDTARSQSFFKVIVGRETFEEPPRKERPMYDAEKTAHYPPSADEVVQEFVAPGPVSRVVANYLEMCSPRAPRTERRPRLRVAAAA